jgi:Transposase DDE domain
MIVIGAGALPGGLTTTKIHLLADSRCRPLARGTTAGQRHDSVAFQPLMDGLRIRRPGPGRPRTRPGRLVADKAYSNRAIRSRLRRRRITTTIREKSDQQKARAAKGSAGGRPPTFDTAARRVASAPYVFLRMSLWSIPRQAYARVTVASRRKPAAPKEPVQSRGDVRVQRLGCQYQTALPN